MTNQDGAVVAGAATLRVMYLGTLAPNDWVISEGKPDERRGTTYKINILALDTNEVGDIKVSEELYKAFGDNAVVRTDIIDLVFRSKFVLSANNGRASRELKFLPDSFRIPNRQAAD